MTPLVSIVIPHYDRVLRLFQALDSVSRQTFTDWEVIIVDDCTPDDPTEIILAKHPSARVFRQERNAGPGAARNRGVTEARGRFVAFLDSDDHWEPLKLEAQIASIMSRSNPDRVLCVTRTRVIEDNNGERLLPERAVKAGEKFADFLYLNNGFAQSSSILLSKSAAASIGFEENLRQYEDHLFFIAAGNAGLEYVLVHEPLVIWYNDSRPDRLTSDDDLYKGELFLNIGSSALGPRATLAFRSKFLGPALFRTRPLKAIGIFARAFATGVLSPRDATLLVMKILLPRRTYHRLRTSIAR